MHKRRILFSLLWQDGNFCLSRNFRLQRAGNFQWLEKNYRFSVISDAIDELIILNVSRTGKDFSSFCAAVEEVVRGAFVPVAVGGGVASVEHASLLLANGADKVVVNTALFDQPESVRELSKTFGSQCVIASIDYKKNEDGSTRVYKSNGTVFTELSVEEASNLAVSLGSGELLLRSMDRDGTGQGYDLEILDRVANLVKIPVIAAGGVGGSKNLSDWLLCERGFAACTANIFNFLGGGLIEARRVISAQGVPLASWEFGWRPLKETV
jgi:cyclase